MSIAAVASISASQPSAVSSPKSVGGSSQLKLESLSFDGGDGAQFRAALDRHTNVKSSSTPAVAKPGNESLGDKMISRAGGLAEEVKREQKNVSKMLETATATGDSMKLMQAMMALNEYQMRVQFISKTASKATSSVDQLTKLQ